MKAPLVKSKLPYLILSGLQASLVSLLFSLCLVKNKTRRKTLQTTFVAGNPLLQDQNLIIVWNMSAIVTVAYSKSF